MAQNSSNQVSNNTVVGMVIGAVIALIFAKTGNPGLIGVGAILGMLLGKALHHRFTKHI